MVVFPVILQQLNLHQLNLLPKCYFYLEQITVTCVAKPKTCNNVPDTFKEPNRKSPALVKGAWINICKRCLVTISKGAIINNIMLLADVKHPFQFFTQCGLKLQCSMRFFLLTISCTK